MSEWIFEYEMEYELVLLSQRDGHVIFGRTLAEQMPSLSLDFNFDLVFSSLGIGGMAPRDHVVKECRR